MKNIKSGSLKLFQLRYIHSDFLSYFAAQGRCMNQLAIFIRQETTEAKKEGEAAPAAAAPKKKKKEKKPEKVDLNH